MSVRLAVGDPQQVKAQFPSTADGQVDVTLISARAGVTSGPFVATDLTNGLYGYMVTDVSEVDRLAVTFSGTFSGTARAITEDVDIAGRHYFRVDEARSRGPIDSTYTDDEIAAMRSAVEDKIEANIGTSFVSRLVAEKKSGGGEAFVRLDSPYVGEIVKVTEDGVDITAQVVLDGQYLWRSASQDIWAWGVRNIEVVYEAGWSTSPPADIVTAAIEATRHEVVRARRQGSPTGVVTIGTEVGTLRMAVAGLEHPFGYPEVDATVLRWAKRLRTVL